MKEKIILGLKGFVFGIANIIPGVSGGTMALTMGIYEDLIGAISNFFKKPKKSIIFLLPFIIGAGLSILLMSKLINLCLDKFPFPTMLFFIGLIFGGLPLLTKKIKHKKVKPFNILLLLLTFGIVLVLSLLNDTGNIVDLANPSIISMVILLLVGMIAAATMVIPGISGSFVLMLLGYYKPIVNTISNLTDFSLLGHNLSILVPFGLGIVIGIVLISKLLEYLFKKHEVPTYYAIIGFVLASVVSLVVSAFAVTITNVLVIVGVLLFSIGTFIGYRLGGE